MAGTINAYLSMRAVLTTVIRHNAVHESRIRTIASPGLCTGVGGMPYEKAAEQMRAAYDSVIGGQWRHVVSPVMAPFALGNKRVNWKRIVD